jgi:hypothetical protein
MTIWMHGRKKFSAAGRETVFLRWHFMLWYAVRKIRRLMRRRHSLSLDILDGCLILQKAGAQQCSAYAIAV